MFVFITKHICYTLLFDTLNFTSHSVLKNMKKNYLNLLICLIMTNIFNCDFSALHSSRLLLSDIVEQGKLRRSHDILNHGEDTVLLIKQIEESHAIIQNEDIHLSVTQLIRKYGYQAEVHQVTTKDGYILTIHRIPGRGTPVFLMHGILCSSDDYVTAGPDGALAYFLASEGYDVWLGNARGNKHSRKHKTHSPDFDSAFWDFSWDEIGRYDLPAMMDYVLNSTGKNKLNYIGWSQGTTSVFVLCSELPEYNEKITLIIAMAPVAWMSHLKSQISRIITLNHELYYNVLRSIGIYEILPNSVIRKALKDLVCGDNPIDKLICRNILHLFVGAGGSTFNFNNLLVILGHVPSGSSVKQFEHYAQEIESGKFRRFDYGGDINTKVYGSRSPPEYPVIKITAPLALLYSNDDWFSNVTDVSILRRKLSNIVDFSLIDRYTHFDFLWASDINKMVNPRILRLLKEYS